MASLGVSDAEREAIERLDRDVIQPSMDALVILEFCTQPSPVLAKLAAEYAGKGVRAVSLDVAKEKLIAAQFRIQAVPTLYAFYHGQPVADLTAYRTEVQLKAVIDQLLGQLKVAAEAPAGPEIEPLLAMGEQILAEGDAPRAAAVFAQIRELVPDNAEAAGGLVRALIAAGELAEAQAALAALPPETAKHAAVTRAAAALELAAAAPRRRHRRAGGADRRRPRRSPGAVRPGRPRRWPATATPPPTNCSRSSPATATGTRVRHDRNSSSCSRRRASRTRGPGRSGGGCRPCCSRDGPTGRRNEVGADH